jgi:hypothetical protein
MDSSSAQTLLIVLVIGMFAGFSIGLLVFFVVMSKSRQKIVCFIW